MDNTLAEKIFKKIEEAYNRKSIYTPVGLRMSVDTTNYLRHYNGKKSDILWILKWFHDNTLPHLKIIIDRMNDQGEYIFSPDPRDIIDGKTLE